MESRIKAACYCRVSTKKEEQEMSLENQQKFFRDFARQQKMDIYGIYTDDGISGKSLKKRAGFNRMVTDAVNGRFSKILVKDVSRFARNTYDFLGIIRELKTSGIEVQFITANMTTYDSELMLTILAAVAQEESSNLSKRVKFAKQQSAKEGRVPSMVYGYDKAPGDRFKLTINEGEARAVERIFKLYGEGRMSPYQIAKLLNSEKVPTKRGAGYQWSQTVVSNILKNRLYIGQVCNRKSEVIDFINEKRLKYSESEWITVDRPEFRIISDELFEKAAEERKKREKGRQSHCAQKKTGGQRPSVKYPLSNLLICAEGNDSFRRRVRHGKKGAHAYWVCSKRDRGKALCSNPVKADERQLEDVILDFLIEMAGGGSAVLKKCRDEARRQLGLRYEKEYSRRALISEQKQLRAKQGKLTGLFLEGVISRQALEDAIGPINQRMEELEYMAKSYSWGGKCQALEACLELIEGMESKGFCGILDNAFLKSIFDKFIIYPDGKAVAYINPDGYNGHQEAIPFCELPF